MRFVDAHTHMELFAFKEIDLEDVRGIEDLLRKLEGFGGDSLALWGWDERKIGVFLEKKHIDHLDFPLLLIRVDGHVGVVNSKAIEVLGIEEGEKFDPERGLLFEDRLWEAANRLKPKGERLANCIRKGLLKARDMGVVEIHDYVDEEVARIYLSEDDLPVSVVLMPYYETYRDVLKNFEEKEKVRIGWVKVYVDGSIGARTAYLKEPYADREDWRGVLLKTWEEIAGIITELEGQGLRVSLHAIGDGAIEECLRAFEEVGPRLRYHRIEHAELITEDQALRARRMNLLLCTQPNFNPYFMDTYVKALGEERARRVNPLRMLDSVGVDMVFGSDMMPFDPTFGFRYAEKVLSRSKAEYYYFGWREEGRYLEI
ncbi:MAG: amidohydrolase family protein [Aquificota bacterium]|nr:amidohydrolase family protein [Aquificota bacterium]